MDTKAHMNDPGEASTIPAKYTEDWICDRCGSMTVEFAILYLQTPGTKFSGSDWKYGFPAKFYISPVQSMYGRAHTKFLTVHLRDADDDTFKKFADLSREIFGITWHRNEAGAIGFNCPQPGGHHGFQRFGEIDSDGTPFHMDGYDSAAIAQILNPAPVAAAAAE